MAVSYLTQDEVAEAAVALAQTAGETIDIASPWIEPVPIQRLLGPALPRIRSGELKVRVVYRLSEETDLRITDLAALEMLATEGVHVRYSGRLHAKLVIVDRRKAVVGSANLTRRAGYGYGSQPMWRNEEGAVILDGDDAAGEAARHFDQIWDGAEEIQPDLVGVVMDFPTVREFRFIAIREISAGQLVAAGDSSSGTVVGEITEVTTYNQSFPQMTEEMFLTQGYGGRGERRIHLPDLPTLFSHPLKDRGFLVAKTFFHPESAFQIARVAVLRQVADDNDPATAVRPVPPGTSVAAPSNAMLRRLLGDGDLQVGRMQRHPDIPVFVRSDEILTKHLAVLGMTGSGKSNGLKHMLRELKPSQRALRVVVVDTHGEYAASAADIDPKAMLIDVSIPDKVNLLDWEMVREHFSVERMSSKIKACLREAAKSEDADGAVAVLGAAGVDTLDEIAEALATTPEGFRFGEEAPRIVDLNGTPVDLDEQILYILDLRGTETFAVRSRKCAIVANQVFNDGKSALGARPTLLVVDEAHNFIPERTTGYMAEAARHGSLGAVTTIAVEGRKFNVGLVISSQRPSRIAKDVLAQMNSQFIFRLANLEDLSYVRESFEAAGSGLLADLPNLDTGVCLCAGTMIAMPVRCDMPLFASRLIEEVPVIDTGLRPALEQAVRAVLPQAVVAEDEAGLVIFAGAQAEVTLRKRPDGGTLEINCADAETAERIRAAVIEAVSADGA